MAPVTALPGKIVSNGRPVNACIAKYPVRPALTTIAKYTSIPLYFTPTNGMVSITKKQMAKKAGIMVILQDLTESG